MKKLIFIFFIILSNHFFYSQTFSGGGGAIPDSGPVTSFSLSVTSLSPAILNSSFGVKTVRININHPYDSDLKIKLKSPTGTIVNLSMSNGSSGQNYTNTCFENGIFASIQNGVAPFTGTYTPEGSFSNFNNGQNGNGIWELLVQDISMQDVGSVINWSITFDNPTISFNSNLPIVVVNCSQTILDEPKVNATMGIIYNGVGVTNNYSDPFNNYNNNIGIELRGSTSQSFFPQKSYGLETRDNLGVKTKASLLNMPTESDWILYAPYDDKTCLRNVLSYDISRKMGHYASRTKHVELFLNGQYQGIYVLMEKIKRDSSRVNIAKLKPTDIAGDDLTGGYIIKIDKPTGNSIDGWVSNFQTSNATDINFLYHYPNSTDIVPAQKSYIQSFMNDFENALNGPDFTDQFIGYRKYMGVNIAIDFLLLNEVSKNADGYRISAYMFKDKDSKGGKLKMGPVWDYNIAWNNANYCGGDQYTGWQYNFNNVCNDTYQVPFWWNRLLQDPAFQNQIKCRWVELRQTTLHLNNINHVIDSIVTHINQAQVRHFQKWPILGVYTWPNPSPIPASFPEEITSIKTWIQNRISWMDANIQGNCDVGLSNNSFDEANLKIYPNPSTGKFKIELIGFEATEYCIINKLGQTIVRSKIDEVNDVDLSNQASGIYFLSIKTKNRTILKKIILQ